MSIYIDLFFIFNIIMDGIIIMGVSALLRRKTNTLRIIIASLLGGVSSLLLFSHLNKIAIEIISIIIMSLISFGYKEIRYTIKNIIYLYLVSIILGGLLYLLNIKIDNSLIFYTFAIIISAEVITLYIKETKKIKNNYNNYYKIDICFTEDNKLSLIGFIDTGNNLYDPYFRRPIILLNKKYQKEYNYILVPCHTAFSSSLIKCMKPEYIILNGVTIKNVLVGFSDNIKLIDGVDVILHKDLLKGE